MTAPDPTATSTHPPTATATATHPATATPNAPGPSPPDQQPPSASATQGQPGAWMTGLTPEQINSLKLWYPQFYHDMRAKNPGQPEAAIKQYVDQVFVQQVTRCRDISRQQQAQQQLRVQQQQLEMQMAQLREFQRRQQLLSQQEEMQRRPSSQDKGSPAPVTTTTVAQASVQLHHQQAQHAAAVARLDPSLIWREELDYPARIRGEGDRIVTKESLRNLLDAMGEGDEKIAEDSGVVEQLDAMAHDLVTSLVGFGVETARRVGEPAVMPQHMAMYAGRHWALDVPGFTRHAYVLPPGETRREGERGGGNNMGVTMRPESDAMRMEEARRVTHAQMRAAAPAPVTVGEGGAGKGVGGGGAGGRG